MADGTVKQEIKIYYKFIGFVDEFEYILNTTNDDTAEMMEEAVKKITQQVEERYYSCLLYTSRCV